MSRKNIPLEIIFSERLKQAMDKKGLNQERLAQLGNVGQGTVSKYLQGKVSAPDSNILKRISIVLDVSVDWLLGKDSGQLADQFLEAQQPAPQELPPAKFQPSLLARLGKAPARLKVQSADDRHRPDRQLLSDIIALLEDVCKERCLDLPAALKGQIISLLYEVHQDTAKPVSRQTVIAFLDLYL